jgi:hypothetical protein
MAALRDVPASYVILRELIYSVGLVTAPCAIVPERLRAFRTARTKTLFWAVEVWLTSGSWAAKNSRISRATRFGRQRTHRDFGASLTLTWTRQRAITSSNDRPGKGGEPWTLLIRGPPLVNLWNGTDPYRGRCALSSVRVQRAPSWAARRSQTASFPSRSRLIIRQ